MASVLVLALAVTAPAFAANEQVANGRLTDSNGDPVAGETIECRLQNGSQSVTTTSDVNGDYACSLDTASFIVDETAYGVEIRDLTDGYSYGGQELVTWSGQSQKVDFELTLSPKTISVTVQDDSGDPVAAVVTVQSIDLADNAEDIQSIENAPEGSADISVPGGAFMVTVDADLSGGDNADQYPWLNVHGGQEVVFTQDSSSETENITFNVVEGTRKVTVKMVDKDGATLTSDNFNADIKFTGYVKDYGRVSTVRKTIGATSEASVYLLPGIWSVEAFHVSQLDGQYFDSAETTFVVAAGTEEIDWGTITAKDAIGVISGTVDILNDDTNTVKLAATNLETGDQFSTTAGSDGSFTFDNVEPGTYSVTVSQDGYIPAESATATVTASDTTETGLEVTARQADVTLRGSIEDGNADALQDFPATIEATVGGQVFSAPVGDDGSYSIALYSDGLVGESVALNVVTLPGAERYQEESVSVTMAAGEIVQDVPTVTTEGTITGSLIDQSGDAVTSTAFGEDAMVKAIHVESGSVEEATVASDGSFSMNVGSGDWKIVPDVVDPNATVRTSTISDELVTVTASGAHENDVQLNVNGGSVTGEVTDASGNPLENVPVILTNGPAIQAAGADNGTPIDENDIVVVETLTNDKGQYSESLPAGEYTVVFGSAVSDDSLSEPDLKTVTVEESGTVTADGAFKEADKTVSGTIGSGFDSGAVTAYSPSGATETAEVDDNGEYSMDLADGDWKFVASGVKDGNYWSVASQNTTTISKDATVSPTLEDSGVAFPAAVTVVGDASQPVSVANTVGASVNLPAYAAALEGEVTVTLQPVVEASVTPNALQNGISYEVNVMNGDGVPVTSLYRDVTIEIPLDEALVDADPGSLNAAYHDSGMQQFFSDGLVAHQANDKMIIQTDHLSRFAAVSPDSISATPTKPRALKAKKLKKKKARLTWKAPKSGTVTKYKVQLRECKNDTKAKCKKKKHFKKKKTWKKYTKVKKQTKRTVKRKQVKKLKAGTFYQFRVRAANGADNGPWAKWKRFKTKPAA